MSIRPTQAPPAQSSPAQIPHHDAVAIDALILQRMQATLGLVGTDQAIATGYEIMLDRLAEMQSLSQSGDMPGIATRSDAIGALGQAISMITLSMVAEDVHACALQGESAALSATLARLERVVDRSVMTLWGL